MLSRYNIAAYPIDDDVVQAYFRIAAHFKDSEDHYCLAPGRALPHVTLCQFKAQDDDRAQEYVREFLSTPLTVTPTGFFYINPGTEEHSGKFWVGHSVARTPALLQINEKIVVALNKQAPTVYGSTGDNYFPHFTLARIRKTDLVLSAAVFADAIMLRPFSCALCLGASDKNGQFLKIIAR